MIAAPRAGSPTHSIDWYDFLARPRLTPPDGASLDRLRDTSILVTGAGGSIGSALSLRLAALFPRNLLLLDASEDALHRLQLALARQVGKPSAQLLLGNVADRALLDEILAANRVQLIFHAAAYKHVPLLEQHPLAALANNALATLTLAEAAQQAARQAAQQAGVTRIVLVSTDKAAAPASILGASKRIAERLVLARQGVALRLANVLGTIGSVSETFARQIAAGGPVTVTTPHAERFFLTLEEAVDLLLAAALDAPPSSLLAPRLTRQHRIADLAAFLIASQSPTQPVPVAFTGSRPGDKPSEVFWTGDELPLPENIHPALEIKQEAIQDLTSPTLPPSLIEQLQHAVRDRDLALALEAVQLLVPEYSPSESIAARLRPSATGMTP